jgi:F-type H+-transporting ATPase subunit delta
VGECYFSLFAVLLRAESAGAHPNVRFIIDNFVRSGMSVAANRYARALLDVLYPKNAETGHDQLSRINAILSEHPEARRMLENPTVPVERRKGLVKEITGALGTIPEVRNFIDILIDRNRLNLLDEIIKTYQKYLDQKLGIVRASVTAAVPLDDAQRAILMTKLQKATGKQVRMEVSVDPALLGGVIARVDSTIYDGSLRQQLESFKEKLVQG